MRKFRYLFFVLFLVISPLILNAQDDELRLGLRAGHNAAFGGFAAVSLETLQTFCGNFSVNGGLQYNTIGKTALEARPAYRIPFKCGDFYVEALVSYSNLSSMNSFAAGAGAKLDFRFVSGRLGYFYRSYFGHGGRIEEPFNIYYDFRAHFLRKVENWNLDLVVTNCEMFDLERHYQPTFIAEGSFFPTSNLGISFGVGCKPSGMFHLSAGYYQSYIKTGVCYRW